jgi:hypothetical protein
MLIFKEEKSLLIVIVKRLDMNQTKEQETPLMVANFKFYWKLSSKFKKNQELKNIINISQMLQQEHSMDENQMKFN